MSYIQITIANGGEVFVHDWDEAEEAVRKIEEAGHRVDSVEEVK